MAGHRFRGNRPPRAPLIDDRNDVRYEDDRVARVFVDMYPDGGTLEMVGAMFDLTRERIRQIEAKAIRKLKKVCDEEGIDIRDILRRDPPDYADYASCSE